MRRRKSSCSDIDHRQTSWATSKNSVKLDLYIEDDELQTNGGVPLRHRTPSPTNISRHSLPDRRTSSTNIEDLAEEVLCLRLLSTRTRYRFGGLKIHIISPVFNVDKLFNVEFDQDSQVSLIKSQQSNLSRCKSDADSFNSASPKVASSSAKTATIVISPDRDDDGPLTRGSNANLSLLSANLTLFEEPSRCSPNKSQHVSVHSLNKTSDCTNISENSEPAVSLDRLVESVKNVRVKNAPAKSSLIESFDLETKQLKKSKSKISNTKRRHTHYYCYIPSSISQSAATSKSTATTSTYTGNSKTNSYDSRNTDDTQRGLKRFVAKKMNDTWRFMTKKMTDTLFKHTSSENL